MRNIFRALIRSIPLFAVALATGVVALLTLLVFIPGFGLGLVFLLPEPIVYGRRFTNRVRRIIGGWSGHPIAIPYRPEPPEPPRRPDGLYQHGNGLHKHRWWPRVESRLEWVLGDRATGKDLLFLLLHPVVGGVLAALPWSLIVAGFWKADRYQYAIAAVPTGLILAPLCIALYTRWCRLLLAPTSTAKLERIAIRQQWIGRHLFALGRLVILGATGVLAVASGVIMLLGIVLPWLGLVFAFPPAVEVVRRTAEIRRGLAGRWSDQPIPTPYRPLPDPDREPDGRYRAGKQLYRTERWARWGIRFDTYTHDPATWRDGAWTVVEPLIAALALLPAAVIVASIGLLVADGLDDGLQHHDLAVLVAFRLLVAPVLILIAISSTVTVLRWHGRLTAWLLRPTATAALTLRVEQLTETRADSAADQAAELRRIERDLHDGAQARLVSIGLTVGAIEALIETDPAAARRLATQARESSATALRELRDLVRGIHPPVLAERGLGDAVRALALDCAVPVDVEVELPDRLGAPIESAAYFAVAEALTNAVRHSGATRISVTVTWVAGTLRIAVTDDGDGGAAVDRGTGLGGIARRLGTFDGTLAVHSPAGGPTTITMEVPCALSSAKISSS